MEWAADRITPEASAGLHEQLDRLQSAAASCDLPAFFQEDLRFHRMIWAIGDNLYAARALETVLGSLFASGMIGTGQAAPIELSGEVEKHHRLLDAISDRDGKRAALSLLEIAAGFEKPLP